MSHDKEGNLLPMMLSELSKTVQEALDEHGDMPVGVETYVLGYSYNEDHRLPVSGPPEVISPSWLGSYWKGEFKQAFVLYGA